VAALAPSSRPRNVHRRNDVALHVSFMLLAPSHHPEGVWGAWQVCGRSCGRMALPVPARPTAAILPGSVLLESATRQACQPGRWVPFNMKSVARSAAKASARLASSSNVAFELARQRDAFARRATLELATCLDGVLVHHSSDATVSPRSFGADADPSAAAARRLSMVESPDAAKPASVSATVLHGASPRHLCCPGLLLYSAAPRRAAADGSACVLCFSSPSMQHHPAAGSDDGALSVAEMRHLVDSYGSAVRAPVSKGGGTAMHADHELDAVSNAASLWRSLWPDASKEFAELVSIACVAAVRFVRGTASARWSLCAQVRRNARRHHDSPSSLLCDVLCRIRLLRALHASAQRATRPSVADPLSRCCHPAPPAP